MEPEKNRLQGVWSVISLEVEGSAAPAAAYNGAQITMEGEDFRTAGMGGEYRGTFTVDPAATPSTIDISYTAGPHAGSRSLGIYRIEGDTLTLCLGLAGADRPEHFLTAPGSRHALEVLKRAVPEIESSEAEPAEQDMGFDLPDRGMVTQQGDWVMVDAEMGGQALERNLISVGKRKISGNDLAVLFGGQVFLHARCRTDVEAVPHTIDYLLLEGPNKGQVQRGIFTERDGVVRVCLARPGEARPDAFTTSAADGRTMSSWRRAG